MPFLNITHTHTPTHTRARACARTHTPTHNFSGGVQLEDFLDSRRDKTFGKLLKCDCAEFQMTKYNFLTSRNQCITSTYYLYIRMFNFVTGRVPVFFFCLCIVDCSRFKIAKFHFLAFLFFLTLVL